MKKKQKETLLEGGIIATVLAIAAGLFLISKPGKKLRKDVKQQSAGFFKYLSPQLKKVKQMGEREYKAFVYQALKKYSKARKLSRSEQKAILKEVQKSWKQLKKHLK